MTPLPTTALSLGGSVPFPELAARYLGEYRDKIQLAVAELDEDEMWWRPAPHANSAANLVLHLAGNLSLWILGGLGGAAVDRDRAGEFTADHSLPKAAALARLATVITEAQAVLRSLSPGELDQPVAIQGYAIDRLGAMFHAVEHMSYHTGQLVWIAKAVRREGKPFEFYPRHAGE